MGHHSFQFMRNYTASLLLIAAPLAAQAPVPRALTADDYARAERFLGAATNPLVTGTITVRPSWLPDGRLWYRASTANGFAFVTVDPSRRTRASSFDQTRLAQALALVLNSRVDPNQLPFTTFELSKDGREVMLTASSRRFKCDIQTYQCTPLDTTR